MQDQRRVKKSSRSFVEVNSKWMKSWWTILSLIIETKTMKHSSSQSLTYDLEYHQSAQNG
ncbi:CLUMA_CG003144, isoform A [Clunio marinus]|uniref:CLUMA_CG003144, isoform A n=1 Tax=Clunio marinus TaxID=568069 RepID=A0A1J1HSC9_9DIPT|nr:CLUMA_CG003144, isoform A [Clunio marinus]